MWFITRRRHEAETARLHDEARKLRSERDEARKERNAFRTTARTAAEKFADADATNRRLDGRVEELRKQTYRLADSRTEYLAGLEEQLADARKELAAERRRAERLQARLDDAVGLSASGPIKDSSVWQPGYKAPRPEVKP